LAFAASASKTVTRSPRNVNFTLQTYFVLDNYRSLLASGQAQATSAGLAVFHVEEQHNDT